MFLEMLESDCETIRDVKTKKLLNNYIEDLQEILEETGSEEL